MRVALNILASTVTALMLVLVSVSQYLDQEAFADGLTQENLPPATVGDREASLFVKVNPPVLTSESQQDASMQFRLFDARNNETIKFTTFLISVTKGYGNGDRPLLTDMFHTESGLLTLKIQPEEGPLTVYGTREDFLQAWKADPGGTINIKGPIFLEGGLYHFQIEVFGIDNIRNIFTPDNAPQFDSWLSVGDVSSKEVEYGGQSHNVTIVSYYDRVKEMEFDSDKKMLTWSMPFDWNVERIGENNIFVHEEVKIPRSFQGLGDARAFDATVNGNPIDGRMLAIDPYSSETEMILHYLINKKDILKMAQQVPEGESRDMTFTLAPAADDAQETTTGEMVSDTGGIQVNIEWTPSQLSAEQASIVALAFTDAFSGQNLDGDVLYNLRIVDTDGNEVFSRTGLTAKDGKDQQSIHFPSDKNYQMEVGVTGVAKDGQPIDRTRAGIARGMVVVPEFPFTPIVAAAGLMAAIVAAGKIRKGFPSI